MEPIKPIISMPSYQPTVTEVAIQIAVALASNPAMAESNFRLETIGKTARKIAEDVCKEERENEH